MFVEKQVILATTALMPSAMAVLNLATLHRTAPTSFLPQEDHTPKRDLIQGFDIPTPKGTGHIVPIMVPDIGDISAVHSPTTIPTATEAAASEGSSSAPHQATAAACTTLQPMDAPIIIHTMTLTGIVAPHPTLTTSPMGVTHATPQTGASLTPATPTMLHREHSQEQPSYIQDLQPPLDPNVTRQSPSRIPLQILHQIQIVTPTL